MLLKHITERLSFFVRWGTSRTEQTCFSRNLGLISIVNFPKSLMKHREGEFWSSPRWQDNAFDSELVIWWDWIEVNTGWPVLRAEDHPSPLPVPPNPIKPSFLTIPPSYSLIPEPTNVPLLPPPLSERSLDYTNGHDRKDSPSLSCKLHSLRPNQTSRKQEHTSRPECIILAVK